tara:strand:- start:124 stop:867 length:744 start_codon:yes stop_codon:yes gene_type:complete
MGSTRFPGKVLELVDGTNPALHHTINQLRASKILKNIVIATTTNTEDDVIADFAKKLNIKVFRGDSSDVLSRYYNCAKFFSFSSILRVTADCPLIDPLVVDQGISKFLEKEYDYVTNTHPRTFPDGNETEIFSFRILELAHKKAILPSEREHVTPYFRNNENQFKIFNFTYKKNISNLRWTLDYEQDLKLIKIIFSSIKERPIHLESILRLLENKPDLININNDHQPNEGYQRSLDEDNKFLKKLNK